MTAVTPPTIDAVAAVLDGPTRDGSELRWRVRLARGGEGVLSQLLPELARDEATRRRYARDVARIDEVAAAAGGAIAAVVARGDGWRVRVAPEGTPLEAWLRGGPAPWEDALARIMAIATALRDVHAAGAVLRDLHPRHVVLGARAVFTDVGLARTDILSSRTAASLVLEGSPYAAPEHASHTVVDARADLFTLGVIAWRALTGTLPYGDGPAFLADGRALPSLAALRPDVPPWVTATVERCLAWAPAARPSSATEVLALVRGETGLAPAIVRTTCQACNAPLRGGLRLCLTCGRVPVLFTPASDLDATRVDLTEASEDAAFIPGLKAILDGIALKPIGKLQLLVGDHRLYSKAERAQRRKLPLTLVVTAKAPAAELERRIKALGAKVRLRSVAAVAEAKRRGGLVMAGAGVLGALLAVTMSFTYAPWAAWALGGAAIAFIGALIYVATRTRGLETPLVQLRPLPALVPATDSLTHRLATAAQSVTAHEVRVASCAQPAIVEPNVISAIRPPIVRAFAVMPGAANVPPVRASTSRPSPRSAPASVCALSSETPRTSTNGTRNARFASGAGSRPKDGVARNHATSAPRSSSSRRSPIAPGPMTKTFASPGSTRGSPTPQPKHPGAPSTSAHAHRWHRDADTAIRTRAPLASSAATTASADGGRSTGDLASKPSTSPRNASAAGTVGIGARRCASRIASGVAPPYGGRPVSISNSTHPSA